MATATVLSICNRALGSISARSNIQNLNEGSTEANACNTYFQSTFEQVARSARWGCLKKQAPLTLVLSAPGTPENPDGTLTPYPPTPWWYSYLVPSDSLFIRQLLPPPSVVSNNTGVPLFPVNNYIPNTPLLGFNIPYEVAYGVDKFGNPAEVINTNLSQAQCIYTVNQSNPQFWDSLLQQTMVASLSVFLSASVSGDKQLTQLQMRAAEQYIAQARAMDANESPVSQDRPASWISARNGESGAWGLNTPFFGYDNVAWPLF